MSAIPSDVIDWTCYNCGGPNIEVCFPAWYCAQTNNYIEQDCEAEPLSVFCRDCKQTTEGRDEDGCTLTGRWDR